MTSRESATADDSVFGEDGGDQFSRRFKASWVFGVWGGRIIDTVTVADTYAATLPPPVCHID